MRERNLVFALAASVALWAGYGLAVQCLIGTPQDRGLFGDSYGAFSALFNALTLAGAIYTVFLQLKETREHEEQLNRQHESSVRMALSQERTAAVDLVQLIEKIKDDNAKALTSYLQLIRSMRREGPEAASAVEEARASAKSMARAQLHLATAAQQAMSNLVKQWGLSPELEQAVASVYSKDTSPSDWDKIIDGLS